ncbi:MAG: DUF4783 domain-containing protein [Chitinophagales bacterium]
MTKNSKTRLFITMLIVPIMIFATKVGDLENIAAAISSGNSKELATYFDNTVEVKIANKEGAYSKSQAEAIIKDFFTKNPPTSFSFIHEGNSGGNNAHYAIGNLVTSKGTYRTYVYLKKINNKFVIQELKFDNE